MTKKLTSAFASQSSSVNDIPTTTTEKGKASYEQGFPAETMLPLDNGGIAPDGKDMNGILKDISANIVDMNQGLAIQQYDDTYSQNIGGYPIGARVTLSDNATVVISTIANNQNNPNSNMTGWTLVTDAMMQTWAGRTQRDKNKELISVEDFGGSVDATAQTNNDAFYALEQSYTGRIIDLRGGTYKVLGEFYGNKYKNGYFQFDSKLVHDLELQDTAIITQTPKALECGLSVGETSRNGQMLTRINSGIQGAVLEYRSNILYVLKQVTGSHTDYSEQNKIVAYAWNGAEQLDPIWETNASLEIGHQSLGLKIARYGYRNTTGVLQLWALGGSDLKTERAKYAVRFTPQANTDIVTEKFKLWGDDVNNKINTLCISPSGDRLVMTGKRVSTSTEGVETIHIYARVFDANIFNDGAGDYSTRHSLEFEVANYQTDLQDCTCDGNYIYFIFAGSAYASTQKYLVIYTLAGEFVQDKHVVTGGDRAWYIKNNLGGDLLFETEALFVRPSIFGWDLVIANSNGTPAGSTDRETSFYTTRFNQALDLRGIGDMPALCLDGTNTISSRGVVSFGNPQADGSVKNYLKLSNTTVALTSDTSDAVLYRLMNSARNVSLQVASSGTTGLYDHTNLKWLFSVSASGNITLNGNTWTVGDAIPANTNKNNNGTASNRWLGVYAGKANFNALSVYADNSSAKTGGLVAGDVYRTSTGQLMIVY